MSATVNGTPVTQQIAAFFTNPSCGSISYVVTCPRLFMTFDLPTMTLLLAPTDSADVGSHSCQIVANLDAYPEHLSTVSFVVHIAAASDPCMSVVWSNPTIQPMSNSVNVAPVTQQVADFTTTPNCGSISYGVTCLGSFMTFDYPAMTLKLAPTLAEDVGTHIC